MERSKLARAAVWIWGALPRSEYFDYREPAQQEIQQFVDLAKLIKNTAYLTITAAALWYGLVDPMIIDPLKHQQYQDKTELINK